MSEEKSKFTQRVFTYPHEGYTIKVTVWNEAAAPNPQVLFDYNNVLNAYELAFLQRRAHVKNLPYAIVSLLMTEGKNFQNLRERAKRTGECIMALTSKFKQRRLQAETCLKYRVMELMNWKNVICALDDKPHEWYSTPKNKVGKKLKLDPNKKPVYKILICGKK